MDRRWRENIFWRTRSMQNSSSESAVMMGIGGTQARSVMQMEETISVLLFFLICHLIIAY